MKRMIALTAVMMLLCTQLAGAVGQYPETINIDLTLADTEYSQALAGVKKITAQCRTAKVVRFAYVTGKVATPTAPYMTLKAGAVLWEDDISLNGKTIYFASPDGSVVVELLIYR